MEKYIVMTPGAAVAFDKYEKFMVMSPGRSASNSLANHIKNSLDKKGIPNEVLNFSDLPVVWPEDQENPEQWTVVVSTRRDMLAQVISFHSIVLSHQSHKFRNIELQPFIFPRLSFFTFAHGILFYHDKIFNSKWPQFKKVHWLVYEDIVQDWAATGRQLGFDDWSARSRGHALGYGTIWDKVINKQEVLDWANELRTHYQFTFDSEKYKV